MLREEQRYIDVKGAMHKMCKCQIFSDNQWIYPDTPIEELNSVNLYVARGSDVCFQVLTDHMASADEVLKVCAEGLPSNSEVIMYQLLPAHVGENSDRKMLTTMDYESVRDFVTRKAPFDVYEITRPIMDGKLNEGRVAFFVRINVTKNEVPGEYSGVLTLQVGKETFKINVACKVYKTQIPSLHEANFHMVNWIYYDSLAEQHNVKVWSDEYQKILNAYLDNQLDMRNDYLMLPSGEPIRNEDGKVIDFDFSGMEYVGKMALSKGFTYVMGGFVARFEQWDDQEHFLLWDRQVGVTTIEGFRQLSLYFKRAWECVCRNGWQKYYMQCLVDEPQFPNSPAYRALSGICRQNMPGIQIHDPVETTDIFGALDVWVVKQATYEQYLETYRALQDMGEEIWLYTCGFPGGKVMNRIIDLPLTVSRLPMWLCYKYDAKGFLHWGYHLHNPELEQETCYRPIGEEVTYPAGNSFVVYPGDAEPYYGVRGHAQRSGAYDYELFYQLGLRESGKQEAKELIEKVCHGFDDYNPSALLLDEVRHELLELLG